MSLERKSSLTANLAAAQYPELPKPPADGTVASWHIELSKWYRDLRDVLERDRTGLQKTGVGPGTYGDNH